MLTWFIRFKTLMWGMNANAIYFIHRCCKLQQSGDNYHRTTN